MGCFPFFTRNIHDGGGAALTCADTDSISEFIYEYFSVSVIAGAQDLLGGFKDLVHRHFADHGFQLDFWYKVYIVFLATIYLLMALLKAAAKDLTYGHAENPNVIKGTHKVIQLIGTGNNFNFGHFHNITCPFLRLVGICLHYSVGQHFTGILKAAHNRGATQDGTGIATLTMFNDIKTGQLLSFGSTGFGN